MVYKNELEKNGFVILPNVFSAAELQTARTVVEEVVEHGNLNLEDPFSPYFYRHRTDQGVLFDLFCRHPEFQSFAKNDSILDVLETVLGENIFMYENTLVYKPKNKKNEVPYHQDFINRTDEPTKYVVWIALDDVTIENGAMKVIPTTHKLGFLPYHHVKGETHHTRLNLEGIDVSKYEYATMKAGDVLIFHHLLVHGSDRISSEQPRRAYRFSVQGFEQIYAPRAVPVVLRGGRPSSIYQLHKQPYTEPTPKNWWTRKLNQLGRKLVEL